MRKIENKNCKFVKPKALKKVTATAVVAAAAADAEKLANFVSGFDLEVDVDLDAHARRLPD